MDIISRLKLFLDQCGISNSQFADTCEIPRPTITQLLKGRNKKVSDEVISKIHAAYPTLNIMWLMFGDGEIFVQDNSSSQENVSSQNLSKTPHPGNLFGGQGTGAVNVASQRQQPTISFGESNEVRGQSGASALNDALQSIAKNVNRGAASSPSPSGQRKIVNIMIFYDDNSFESITPMR